MKRPKRKLTRGHISVTPEFYERIVAAATKQNIPRAHVLDAAIRKALDAELAS